MATGTKLMKEISDQFLICKLCQESFKEPKTLTCLHTFCCACIQQQYDEESNRPTRYTLYTRSVTCPLCRKKTDLPTGGVRRLPDNFLVSNLTEVLAKRCTAKVPPCEICHMVRPRSNDACSKCLDCDKLLCRACVELHSTTKVTQGHSLIDVEGQKDIECKAHPEETVRFYCEKCEECICVVCTFQEHKDHDVCSFNDGFAKHKVTLEQLLTRSKERLSAMGSRLKVIEKYETLSKDLKETIRDLAIAYTSQVRAREKELIQQVDQVFSGQVSELAENKAWLQESFDNLQSACNLTEIVMKDKGVEMLLLKKEIQGKMDHLLQTALPPEPADLQHLDVKFVPGEVKLGDVRLPGEGEEEKEPGKVEGLKVVMNGMTIGDAKSATSLPNCEAGKESGKPCAECIDRKRKEAEEARHKRHRDGHGQTTPHEKLLTDGTCHNGHALTTASHVGPSSSGSNTSHSAIQTHPGTDSRRGINNNNNNNNNTDRPPHQPQENVNRARGTMTERHDVRTLKTQTEESCLRDTHLGQAAATGSTYPNTGAAIAAAFLRHKVSDEDLSAHSRPPKARVVAENQQVVINKQTQDVEVATDISLSLSSNPSQTLSALCGAGGGSSGGVQAPDVHRPDLLAETGSAASAAPPVPAVKIRSRKIQTDISSMVDTPGGEKFVSESELQRSVCLTPGSANCPRPPVSRATTVTSRDSTRPPAKCDVSIMTPFKVKIVPATADKMTSSDEVLTHSIGMMASPVIETRTVYIQTRGPRVVSTASGTDFEGQLSKSTTTLLVESVDAETAMPQVLHESRLTWTEPVVTSERATSTGSSSTSDAATLTSQTQTSDFAVQMRPMGVMASTNTLGPNVQHRPCQTTPNVSTKATMPDPLLTPPTPAPALVPPPSPTSSQAVSKAGGKPSAATARPLSMSSVPVVTSDLSARAVEDKATETAPAKVVTRAVGPSVRMLCSRTASTDTLSLLQVTDKETATPTVKTVDEWTHTPQPQTISTGVTPPRPAVLEVGVATLPITLMDQATYTEVKTMRESGIETCLVVCDSETMTDRTVLCDAQTEVEVSMEHEGTTMAGNEVSCLTEQSCGDPAVSPKEMKDSESQCQSPALVDKEVNTARHRRRVKEVQTSFSYTDCLLCQHPDKLQQLGLTKTFTDTSTDPTPPDTHDVATMALSCQPSSPGLTHAGVQTSTASLYDKNVATSFDFEEDVATKPFLAMESQDAATSTESLPYIGLLSEIDVDELIVFPEANFELVSDSDLEDCSVPMVDGETLTEVLDYAEVGTQTLQPVLGEETSTEQNPPEICHEEDFSKHLSSIGVNTLPKVTFEKETSTPAQHLFSKGTMTFFVTKMDKSTSTVSYTRFKTEGSSGQAGGVVAKDTGRQKHVDNKLTMTNRTELRDIAVETDSTLVDGRITECISKLRNVSERLNSPTTRKNMDSEAVNDQSSLHQKQNENLHPPVSAKPPPSPKVHRKENCPSYGTDAVTDEQQRHRQMQRFLVDTGVVLKPKDPSPVRKAQPITTLKPRTPVTPGDLSGYASRSLPRQGSLERQNKVKMGSQVTPPSRLPLLRYNSAPGRIATVPTQTLLRKSGATSPRTSPSKIPVSQKTAPAPGSTMATDNLTSADSGPDSDTVSTCSSQKVQQLPSLPSITETQTPSSCSDSSFHSLESVEPSVNIDTTMTSCHSRTPSNVTSVSDTVGDAVKTNSSADAAPASMEGDGDDSSVSSASAAMAASPVQAISSSSESLSKQKKEKKGFMQRLLSVKKKKKDRSSSREKDTQKEDADSSDHKQKTPTSPMIQKKQTKPQPAQGAKSKPSSSKSSATVPSPQGAEIPKPSSPVSSPVSSRRPSEDLVGKDSSSAASASPTLPPHHYPPLPDPSKSPPAPKKPRPFVYVRQRIFSIQQDNVEEVIEKKEKEKEDKDKEWDSSDSETDH